MKSLLDFVSRDHPHALMPNTGNASSSLNVPLTGTNLSCAPLAANNPGILVWNVIVRRALDL